jgi:DNA polymerase V
MYNHVLSDGIEFIIVFIYTTLFSGIWRNTVQLRSGVVTNAAAGGIMVFVMTNRFRDEPQCSNSATIELPVPTDSTDELIHYDVRCLRSIYRKGFRFYKTGIILTDLAPANLIQTDLFDTVDRNRAKKLMQALDEVNFKYGAGTVAFAAAGIKRPWKTKFNRKSPRYTTRWEELRVVSTV